MILVGTILPKIVAPLSRIAGTEANQTWDQQSNSLVTVGSKLSAKGSLTKTESTTVPVVPSGRILVSAHPPTNTAQIKLSSTKSTVSELVKLCSVLKTPDKDESGMKSPSIITNGRKLAGSKESESSLQTNKKQVIIIHPTPTQAKPGNLQVISMPGQYDTSQAVRQPAASLALPVSTAVPQVKAKTAQQTPISLLSNIKAPQSSSVSGRQVNRNTMTYSVKVNAQGQVVMVIDKKD